MNPVYLLPHLVDLERQQYLGITKNKGEVLPSGPKRPLKNFMTEENAHLTPAGSPSFFFNPKKSQIRSEFFKTYVGHKNDPQTK